MFKLTLVTVLLSIYLNLASVESGGAGFEGQINPRAVNDDPPESQTVLILPHCLVSKSGIPKSKVTGPCDQGRCRKTKIRFLARGKQNKCCCTDWGRPVPISISSSSSFEIVNED